MGNNTKEFVAYSKKLLRVLLQIKEDLATQNYNHAKNLLDELIVDTQGDIEAKDY